MVIFATGANVSNVILLGEVKPLAIASLSLVAKTSYYPY